MCASKNSSPQPPTQSQSNPNDPHPNVYSLYLSTDNPYKSLRLISILIDVGILPKIPPLPDDLTDIDLDLLQPVDVHLHAWSVDLVQVAQDLLDCFVEVGLAILVLHVGNRHVDLVLGGEVDAVVVLRDLVRDLDTADYRGLVGPAARHVTEGVATASEEKSRDVELLYELCG